MNDQVLRALRMAKLALEDTHGGWTRKFGEGYSQSRLDNSIIIKEIALAIGALKDLEHIDDVEVGRDTTIKLAELCDRLAERLKSKETLEDLDARLDPAATEERLRVLAERLYPPKHRCSMTYIKQEGGVGCLQTARFVVSGPNFKYGRKYACDRHLYQTINEMMEKQEGVAHVEAV